MEIQYRLDQWFTESKRTNWHVSVARPQIEYTDFPANGITFYFTNNTILLPREY